MGMFLFWRKPEPKDPLDMDDINRVMGEAEVEMDKLVQEVHTNFCKELDVIEQNALSELEAVGEIFKQGMDQWHQDVLKMLDEAFPTEQRKG